MQVTAPSLDRADFPRLHDAVEKIPRLRYVTCRLKRRCRQARISVETRRHRRQSRGDMAVRKFHDRAGQEWSVWRVQPTSSTAGLQERFQAGWLCFERGDGGGRARLPLDEAPPAWEALPDERLELLCRIAEVASNRTPPG